MKLEEAIKIQEACTESAKKGKLKEGCEHCPLDKTVYLINGRNEIRQNLCIVLISIDAQIKNFENP